MRGEGLGTRLLQALVQRNRILCHRLDPAHLLRQYLLSACADCVYQAFPCVEGLGTRLIDSITVKQYSGTPSNRMSLLPDTIIDTQNTIALLTHLI